MLFRRLSTYAELAVSGRHRESSWRPVSASNSHVPEKEGVEGSRPGRNCSDEHLEVPERVAGEGGSVQHPDERVRFPPDGGGAPPWRLIYRRGQWQHASSDAWAIDDHIIVLLYSHLGIMIYLFAPVLQPCFLILFPCKEK